MKSAKMWMAAVVTLAASMIMSCTGDPVQPVESSVQPRPAKSTVGTLQSLPPRKVCMVNNKYVGSDQLPVEYEGKTFYGCCEMCRKRIPAEREVRFAADPYTGEEVNKAEAYIALLDSANGDVGYFKDEQNYAAFKKAR